MCCNKLVKELCRSCSLHCARQHSCSHISSHCHSVIGAIVDCLKKGIAFLHRNFHMICSRRAEGSHQAHHSCAKKLGSIVVSSTSIPTKFKEHREAHLLCETNP